VQQDKLLAPRGATQPLVPQVAPELRQVHTLTVRAQMDQVQQDKLLAQRGATLQLRALQVAPKLRQVHTLTVQAQMDQALRRKPLAA